MEKEEVTIINAVISSASIGIARGFIIESWLHLDYGGSGQGFGGFALGGMPDSDSKLSNGSQQLIGEWIRHVFRVTGADTWEKVKGKPIRVKVRNEGLGQDIVAIGHYIEDKWFDYKAVFSDVTDQSQ